LFCYDTIYLLNTSPQTVHQHRSTELAAIFVGKLISLSAAIVSHDHNYLAPFPSHGWL